MLTPNDLLRFMERHGIEGELITLDEPTPTVETAARAVGTSPDQIVKSVLFAVNDERVLAITCGTQLIESRSIAALYGVGRKRVRLANAEIVLETTGYPVGTVPPFGHPQPIRTLIAPQVLEHREVYAGGGAHTTLVRLDPQAILTITQAQIVEMRPQP